MTGHAVEPSYELGAWATLSRRFSPYLDLALGLVAAGLVSLLSLLATTSPRSTPGSSRPTRRRSSRRPWPGCRWSGVVRVRWCRSRSSSLGCLVVTLTDHYIGLLSVLLLFSLYSLAAHGRRRDRVCSGWWRASSCSSGLPCSTSPTCGPPTCCRPARCWSARLGARRRHPLPPCPAGGATSRCQAGSSDRARAGRPGHRRGAPADRPRAARRGRPQHVADRGAGRGGRARDPHRRRRGRAGTGDHRRHQPQGADPDPVDAGPAARGGHRPRRARRCRRSTTSTPSSRTCGRPASTVSLAVDGDPPSAGSRCRADRLPSRPGVADQRAEALRRDRGADVGVTYAEDALDIEVPDVVHGRRAASSERARSRHRAVTDSSACGSAPGCSAARSTSARPAGGFPVHAHLPSPPVVGAVIRVAVVDDQELVRSGFVVLLGSSAGHRGRRRGRRRCRGLGAVPSYVAGRRADGRADAADGRARGDPADHRPTRGAPTRTCSS